MLSKHNSTLVQYLSQSKLTSAPSSPTPAESSHPVAVSTLTMVSLQLATEVRMELSTSLSRTPGAHPGETKVTSNSALHPTLQKVPAVS